MLLIDREFLSRLSFTFLSFYLPGNIIYSREDSRSLLTIGGLNVCYFSPTPFSPTPTHSLSQLIQTISRKYLALLANSGTSEKIEHNYSKHFNTDLMNVVFYWAHLFIDLLFFLQIYTHPQLNRKSRMRHGGKILMFIARMEQRILPNNIQGIHHIHTYKKFVHLSIFIEQI